MVKKTAKKVVKKATAKKTKHELGKTFHAWVCRLKDGTYYYKTWRTKNDVGLCKDEGDTAVRVRFVEVK